MAARADTNAGSGLGFDDLIGELRALAGSFQDKRTGRNTRYSIEDIVLAAFSVFWTQSPSFLAHQSTMQQVRGQSNAGTLFAMTAIPTDNPIRDLLDAVPPEAVFPLFKRIVERLDAAGYLKSYRVLEDQLLIALDGTQTSGEAVRFGKHLVECGLHRGTYARQHHREHAPHGEFALPGERSRT